ncbi:hypothetical protein L873DRAFT_32384 [Choiromyces venosus 120613-1]|uniref:Uncharacterized protein n=1 Tax=Choiromyces venosus 120613-1 TaxID=1336337 RepID=A0A3N4K6N9_9PEZI|nr:hypothetical protein L873DRAFT_32384 [Choiromyces venosus 120613-1]
MQKLTLILILSLLLILFIGTPPVGGLEEAGAAADSPPPETHSKSASPSPPAQSRLSIDTKQIQCVQPPKKRQKSARVRSKGSINSRPQSRQPGGKSGAGGKSRGGKKLKIRQVVKLPLNWPAKADVEGAADRLEEWGLKFDDGRLKRDKCKVTMINVGCSTLIRYKGASIRFCPRRGMGGYTGGCGDIAQAVRAITSKCGGGGKDRLKAKLPLDIGTILVEKSIFNYFID